MSSTIMRLLVIACLWMQCSAGMWMFGAPRTRARAREYAHHAVLNSKLVQKGEHKQTGLIADIARVLPLDVAAQAPVTSRKKSALRIRDDLKKLQ